MADRFRLSELPKVDVLASAPELEEYVPVVRTKAARAAVERLRGLALSGAEVDAHTATALAVQEADALIRPSIRPVINLSGVVCHTGLGRAPLAPSAIEAIARSAGGYSTIEFDIDSGKRGDRQSHVRDLPCELTGAEDAFMVNNAAAAVLLSLTALCRGSEVVLSRGQMVEIGGSFRMPDIVRQSGAKLVEVGCTNRTRISDYAAAMHDGTGAILRCHPSNFAIVGFTEEAPANELAELAHRIGVLYIDDQGTGLILDTTKFGMPKLPTLQDSLRAGADVVLASGDKLLGGPQAGLILGSSQALATIREHPIARAVRVDKLTLAAMEATLRLYRDGEEHEVPIWQTLSKPLDQVRLSAETIAAAYRGRSVIEAGVTEAGSGAAPGTGVATWRVGLDCVRPDSLAANLRSLPTPIIGRIEKGRIWLDPRTVSETELSKVAEALRGLDS